jgi:hypothetical protein
MSIRCDTVQRLPNVFEIQHALYRRIGIFWDVLWNME